MIYAPGATSQSVDVQVVDDTGLAVTGLVASTFPAVSWSRAGNTAATSVSLSDLSLITSAWTSGGLKERSGGYYRLDVPDAAFASAGCVTLIGDASGKHLLAREAVVATLPANVTQLLGTAWLTPAVAGTPDVNAKQLGGTAQTGRDVGASVNVGHVNSVAATGVTSVNANLGTTQPVNFTGTAGSALAKVDAVDIAGSAVSASAAQIGVNVVNFGGSAGTFSSGKPAVTVASADVTGNVAADLQTVKTQAVTCASGVTVSPNVGTTQPTNFTGTGASALVKTDVVDFGGTAGTFSGGRPEVNATYWAGEVTTADANLYPVVGTVAGSVFGDVNGKVIGGGSSNCTGVGVQSDLRQFAGTAFTSTAGRVAAAFSTMFNVAAPALTAASVNQTGDNYARLGAPAGASVSADVAAVKADTGTLLGRVTSTLFSGITSVGKWLGVLAGKTADASTLAELNATTAGATFNNASDSLEAQKDAGYSTLDAAGVRSAVGLAGANLDTQLTAKQATFTTSTGVTFPSNFASLSIDANGRVKSQTGVSKNVALSGFTFVMVSSSDSVTPATGLTVTATRSLDGAAFASCTNSVTELSNGVYKLDLSAADMNGNTVLLRFAASGADVRFIELVTSP